MYPEWNQLATHRNPPAILKTKLQLPVKILTGPGPTNCSDRVLQSLKNQIIGHLHPEVCQVIAPYVQIIQKGKLTESKDSD